MNSKIKYQDESVDEAENDLPSREEELTFKVLETYDNLLRKNAQGLIDNAQTDIAINAIIEACGWGVERKTLRLISSTKIEKDSSFIKKRVFLNAAFTSLIMVAIDEDNWGFEVKTDINPANGRWGASKRFDFSNETAPTLQCLTTFDKVCDQIIKKKYVEVNP